MTDGGGSGDGDPWEELVEARPSGYGPPESPRRSRLQVLGVLGAIVLLGGLAVAARLTVWPRPRPVAVPGGVEYHDVRPEFRQYKSSSGCHPETWALSMWADVDGRRWAASIDQAIEAPSEPGTLFVPDKGHGWGTAAPAEGTFTSGSFSVQLRSIGLDQTPMSLRICESL